MVKAFLRWLRCWLFHDSFNECLVSLTRSLSPCGTLRIDTMTFKCMTCGRERTI